MMFDAPRLGTVAAIRRHVRLLLIRRTNAPEGEPTTWEPASMTGWNGSPSMPCPNR